jgi:hypothetical protein
VTRARREATLRRLRAYIDAGRYPINDVAPYATPIFVDSRGRRCAVADLLDATGRGDLVEHVARRQNLARVHDLASEPALTEWLAYNGLRASEAARIQPAYPPAYHAPMEPDWSPTVSVLAAAHVAATEAIGVEAILATGVRAGIRRNLHGASDNGNSRYESLALAVEYTRSITVNRGATNHLALVLQWEPAINDRGAQWYVLGGPLASIDGDKRPGSGFGGELGVGFSFRRRSTPIFVELMTQGLAQDGHATVRLGLQIGAVW